MVIEAGTDGGRLNPLLELERSVEIAEGGGTAVIVRLSVDTVAKRVRVPDDRLVAERPFLCLLKILLEAGPGGRVMPAINSN